MPVILETIDAIARRLKREIASGALGKRGNPDLVPLLPMLSIPPLPMWLAVHREIRGNRIALAVHPLPFTPHRYRRG